MAAAPSAYTEALALVFSLREGLIALIETVRPVMLAFSPTTARVFVVALDVAEASPDEMPPPPLEVLNTFRVAWSPDEI